MADVLEIYTAILLREIERLKALYPELEDDAELLADMVEGSTSFDTILSRLTVAFLEKVALKEANSMIQADLRLRGARFDRGAEALKALAMSVMVAAGKRTAILPAATLSITKGRNKLVLDDDFNAQGYMKIEAKPMRADIAAALATGDDIPGARLEPSAEHLSVRTK